MDRDAPLDRQPPDARLDLSEGQLLSGRFEIRRRIGVGGTGAVFAAFDRERGEEIAIKLFLPQLLQNERGRKRFGHETELASHLSHPGIVKVFETHREGVLHFITMELLKGTTLRRKMEAPSAAHQHPSVAEVVRMGVALCDALGYAHQHIVHGSVSPDHILLCDDETVKLTDFGTARLLHVGQSTMIDVSMGSACYMAPEQLKGRKDIDHRADQYATGAVLYEMLTGEAPAGRVKPAKQRRPDTPQSLSRALDRALESNPADRFADMSSFAAALTGSASSPAGGRRFWAVAAAILLLATAGVTFPKWRTPVGSMMRSALRDPQVQIAAEQARMQAIASASSWQEVAKALPGEQVPDEIARAEQAVLEGNNHLEAMRYGGAEQSFRQASELYESQVTAATQLMRDEPSSVAGAARNLSENLDTLERELYGRVAQAARHLEGCERNLRGARTDDEREAIETRRRSAGAELDLMHRLQSLTHTHVFNASLRGEIANGLNQADQQLEAARYREALASYAKTKARLAELLAWPDQAESALRRQSNLSRAIEQARAALGPRALELNQVQTAFDDAAVQMARGDEELAGGRVPEAMAIYETAREVLLAVKHQAATNLMSRAQVFDSKGKRSAAVLVLDELITVDPNHTAAHELRRKILSHRIVNSIGMELVFIGPGEFLMGSPSDELGRDEDERQHPVKLTTGFLMSATEVTQSQWRTVMGDNPSEWKGDDLPVERVSWEQAVEFCRRLSLEEGRRYRLPTEAEWEYACRAGTSSPFSFGETVSTAQANYDGDTAYGNGSKGVYRAETVPVAGFPANAWGLYDMHGNVWEWCAAPSEPRALARADVTESQSNTPATSRDDQAQATLLPPDSAPIEPHVLRGGSWRNRPRYCRCANRVTDTEGSAMGNIGFRVVLEESE